MLLINDSYFFLNGAVGALALTAKLFVVSHDTVFGLAVWLLLLDVVFSVFSIAELNVVLLYHR